jgi:trans-aconitate 2-methyltransferase
LANPHYSFGDTQIARQRLDLLSSVFDPSSRAFLATRVLKRPRVALDLGCGPGNTTRMISAVTGADRTVGLDRSPAFIAAARKRGGAGVEFGVWDAASPLPYDEVDLLYARLLLAHLRDPADLVAAWARRLRAGGQLLLDELEAIETRNDIFVKYLTMAAAVVRANGAEMFAGPILARQREAEGCGFTQSEVVTLRVEPVIAARMFRLNLQEWGKHAWVHDNYGTAAVTSIGEQLDHLVNAGSGEGITWKLRQIVIEKRGRP